MDKNIVIRSADKGGGIVIQDYSKYRLEILNQLSDSNTYLKLNGDPTIQVKCLIENVLQTGLEQDFLDQDLWEFLHQSNPRTPMIYPPPKVHKNLQDPPGRPIISAVGGILEPLARWLDFLFKETIESLPTYIKDTPNFIHLISTVNLPIEPVSLVTCDINSLYTIIAHAGGVQAMRQILLDSKKYEDPSIDYVMEILELVLTQNYFHFELDWYRQLAGTSMGASMAPIYANGYMFGFESQHILEPFKDIIMICGCYIDDIFMIVEGDTSVAEVYKLRCPCGLTYIGNTDLPLRERIRNHRSSIRVAYRDQKSDLPVAKHFLEQGHTLPTLKLMAIDHIPVPRKGGDRKKMLLQRELYWIRTLRTVYPNGLNEKYTLSAFL
ncbi:Hypothetical predicted protein [Pelobates cultripes]|uniref:GIY-YIG domain-containing protein n=1 Tax=Pelobates cultripes TaxID=61616 RepID=A0AAD1RP54_PELCU|nr:Hypothetical predicted protein [Pelobates cultripes]